MAVTWSGNPRTWDTGDLTTASLLNSELRDRMDWLKDAADTDVMGVVTQAAVSSAVTTSSATYTPVSGLSVTVSKEQANSDSDLYVMATLSVQVDSATGYGEIDVRLYDVTAGTQVGEQYKHATNNPPEPSGIAMQFAQSALNAGSRTYRVEFRIAGSASQVSVQQGRLLVKELAK